MINQEVKGTLAKLMATENLTVEHRKVSTAAFDVEQRVLILPIWKSASATVYDLLVGHEVGHALYTPNKDFGNVSKAFVNVLEDARIEKMMKKQYPGLRKSFFEGYRELWQSDFFGVKDEDPKNLSLIDRINLYYKGNPQIPFTDEEFVWVKRVGNTNTFEDVVNLAKELYEYAERKEEEKVDDMDMPLPSNDEGEKQADSEEEVTPAESETEEDREWFTDDDPEKREPKEKDSADLDTPSYDAGSKSNVDETESVTDAALQEALETLVDDDAKEWIYINVPEFDTKKMIVPAQQIQSDLDTHFKSCVEGHDYWEKKLSYVDNHYNKFKKDTQKSVNYLVKQFEMKKSAAEYKRAAVSKTGVLDTNKLHQYKLTDDIFKKVTVVPEGKNHGLIMHIDWSGSMQYQLLDTLKQTFNLVWFCKKAGIPFRVYAFQSGFRASHEPDRIIDGIGPGDLSVESDFRLLELLSSRQNAKSLENSMRLVYTQAFSIGGSHIPSDYRYGLGGTPLVEAVLCTRDLVKDLKRTENVTKVNVICLTDGESNPMSYCEKDIYTNDGKLRPRYLCHQYRKVFVLRDPKTGYQRKINSSPQYTTKEIVSFFREITDYNWIGIRLCSKNDLVRLVREFAYEELTSVDKQWKKERFASIKGNIGFTEAFFMPDKNIGLNSQDLEVKQKKEVATKAELTRAFKKHMGSKMTNKTILNAFIDQIA